MTKRFAPKLAPLLLAVTVMFASVALAQIDDRSRALLEGLSSAQQATEITTLDQTMVMTMPQDGGELTTRTRTAIDFENRRAAIVSELGDGMSTRMVHQDGQTTMHMAGMPMAMPVPPQMAGIFEGIFDQQQDFLAQENATAVYDGEVSYGDLVTGQQVTFTGSYDVMGTTESSESRLLFDAAGNHIATVVEVDGDTIVMLYDDPASGDLPMARDATMYQLTDGAASLYATIRYEDVRVNEPLDETLFE